MIPEATRTSDRLPFIRTYAAEYNTQPELALTAANRRILMDTRAGLFVTVFYGILDPASGALTYCNAGHDPPYLLSTRDRGPVQTLGGTGMALGVVDDVVWDQKIVQTAPGDLLVLYTDGVTEAQNAQKAFFGKERLLEVVRANLEPQAERDSSTGQGKSAQAVFDALTKEIHDFMGEAPQFDDITLMVVARD